MAFLSSFYPQPVVPNAIEVTASGSNTARTLSDRFGEVFHVDDYGAKGDWNGTTGNDDTVAIQNAINAAMAAGGGVVRFGANKTYRLNTRNSASSDYGGLKHAHFLRIGSGNTISGFGSTNMRLFFDGQNATLHATAFVDSNSNDILYTFCRFKELHFDRLNFSRNPVSTAANGPTIVALSFCQYDTSESDLIRISNCSFINHAHDIFFDPSLSSHVAWQDIRGKMKRLEVLNCFFNHPYGDHRALGFNGSPYQPTGWAGIMVFNSTWIDTALYDGCYADGLVGATIPNGYNEACHGFLFPLPINCIITNCYFQNCCVELIKATPDEVADSRVFFNGGWTQPEINSTITLTIASDSPANQKLKVGNIYATGSTEYQSRIGGYFRLESNPAGGNYSFAPNTTLTFTRVNPQKYQQPLNRQTSVGGAVPTKVGMVDAELAEKLRLTVANCTFVGNPIRKFDGTLARDTIIDWNAPSILCSYGCIINGNTFIGGGFDYYSEVSVVPHVAKIFVGNHCYKTNPLNTQINGYSVFMRTSNCTIANNYFAYENSRSLKYCLHVAGHDIAIQNNSCIVLEPLNVGTNNVTEGPAFVQYGGAGPWRVLSQSNYLRDLEHYGFSGDAGYVASYIGSIRGAFFITAFSGQQIRLAQQMKSLDGSTWAIGITNDGELEVFK